MKAKDYRLLAKKKVAPISGRLAVITLIILGITGAVGGFGWSFSMGNSNTEIIVFFSIVGALSTIASLIISGPFVYAQATIYKKVCNDEVPSYADPFMGFKHFGKALGLYCLQLLYLFLWGFWSLGIGAIIKGYAYSMAFYIMEEDPSIGFNDAITKSRKMMNGHKWHLFCVEFSYIGWILLSILTLGILFLWVLPKIRVCDYEFYLNLKKNNQE